MTLRHVVMWKFEGDEATRAHHAQQLGTKLEQLVGLVPSLISAEVHRASPLLKNEYDLLLEADFADVEGLDQYQNHPDHVAAAKHIKDVAVARAAIDFEI